MNVKKAKGKVYGGSLTASEKKAMEIEIKRQLAEYDRKHLMEMDALILWVLHNEFGFGEKRLKRFYDSFADLVDELVEHYALEDSDDIWICTHMLKRHGIDVEKWHKEKEVE